MPYIFSIIMYILFYFILFFKTEKGETPHHLLNAALVDTTGQIAVVQRVSIVLLLACLFPQVKPNDSIIGIPHL